MLKLNKIMIALFIISAPFLYGCASEEQPAKTEQHAEEDQHNDHDGAEAESAEEDHRDIVKLSAGELKEFNIRLQTAGPGKLETHVQLTGEIIIPPDNLAHIHPRFSGVVKEVRKHIGDHVKKGEVLAVIESNESLTDYKIVSLIDGTIVEKHLTRGEVVEDGSHGFTIANLHTVWVYLKVYQKDLPYVRKGRKVIISAGKDMPVVQSRIDYISPVMDEQTRTATARVILKNPDDLWKPGLFVTGEVATSTSMVDLLVPKTAIEEIEGQPVIFVETPEGFVPRIITTGKENTLNVEVLSGLRKGERYVSSGGFTLKAQLQKSEFGDGHGH